MWNPGLNALEAYQCNFTSDLQMHGVHKHRHYAKYEHVYRVSLCVLFQSREVLTLQNPNASALTQPLPQTVPMTSSGHGPQTMARFGILPTTGASKLILLFASSTSSTYRKPITLQSQISFSVASASAFRTASTQLRIGLRHWFEELPSTSTQRLPNVVLLFDPTSRRHSEPSVSVCSVVVSTAGASSGSASPSPGSDICKGWG
jgi:hypothetical protein